MPTPHTWRGGSSRRFIVSFVLVLLVPATAVVWLGVRLVEQDRALASRQLRERRESGADRIIAGLQQAVSSTERRLNEPGNLLIRPDDDAVLVTLRSNAVEAFPPDRLLYLPVLPPAIAEATDAFEPGESLEFRTKNYGAAAANFRALTASPSATIRTGALLRLARTLRKMNRADEALRTYATLAGLPDGRLSGLPADLVARRARCSLLEELGRASQLGEEARSLQADLIAARWPIDRGAFVAYVEQVNHWVGSALPVDPEREALSEASEWLWRQWTSGRSEFQSAGRRARPFGGISVSLLWQRLDDRLVVLVAGPRFQQRAWFETQHAALDARSLRVALADDDGRAVLGTVPAGNEAETERRTSAVTRLPWTVFVGSADAAADLDEIAGRRRLLLAGLALLIGLVVAGGYFIVRAASREFAVAQLQSDFVAAVSHEFRTPLTSLQQFTDLLNDDPHLPAAKRRTFYQAQARATDRLRRLVESLLDFGRMEAGARPYRFERRDVGPLVGGIVEDFRRDATPDGFTIEASIDQGLGEIDVDPDAFTRAVWNLLDNAVKYSGTSRTVSVYVAVRDGAVSIRVRDSGLGIPRHEHDQIFKKFVRGASSRAHGIKCTGIGLAMVRHIVEAHGGTVSVDSEAGQGSTFAIAVPAAESSSVATADQSTEARAWIRHENTKSRNVLSFLRVFVPSWLFRLDR